MLSLGRIDAILNDIQGGQATINSLNIKNLHFDPGAELFRNGTSLVFQNTERLQKINETVSKAINSMKFDGTLANIMTESIPE